MDHFHYKIPGWFTFPKLYSYMVDHYGSGSHFVEIGSFQGASAAYMGVEIINSGKNIKFDCIDLWNRSSTTALGTKNPEKFPDNFVQQLFLENTKPVSHVINPIRSGSIEASMLYKDNSLDFVFIDGDHSFEGCMLDLSVWFPKVKKGGHIAGHDYFLALGVQQAVRKFFDKKDDSLFAGEQCWSFYKY